MNNEKSTYPEISRNFQIENTLPDKLIQQGKYHSHKSAGKKALILFSLLLGFSIFGLGGYYLGIQQESSKYKNSHKVVTLPIPTSIPVTKQITPNFQTIEINDWPIYKSSIYGISFRYRPDLIIKEEEKRISLVYDGELNPYDLLFGSSIYFVDNPSKLSSEEYAKNELCKDAFQRPDMNIDTSEYCKKLVVDNLETYKNNNIEGVKTIHNLYENPMYTIIFPFKDKLVVMTSSGETGEGPTELGKETIDKILSTFSY